MPYKSDAQRKKFHALLSEGKIDKSVVDEYDKASKGMKLPERVRPKVVRRKITSVEQLRDLSKKKG